MLRWYDILAVEDLHHMNGSNLDSEVCYTAYWIHASSAIPGPVPDLVPDLSMRRPPDPVSVPLECCICSVGILCWFTTASHEDIATSLYWWY